jgi:hypothetical protein
VEENLKKCRATTIVYFVILIFHFFHFFLLCLGLRSKVRQFLLKRAFKLFLLIATSALVLVQDQNFGNFTVYN